jgi:hypothetical protein
VVIEERNPSGTWRLAMTARLFALCFALTSVSAFAATNPAFFANGVNPSSGVQGNTIFRWTTAAKNADGSPIAMVLHIVSANSGDVPFAMAFDGGSTTGGAYFHFDKTLSYSGQYQYYFVATTNAGGSMRYPLFSGTFAGPISTAALPDLIGSWMNTLPSVVVSGQPVVLQGQVMNAGSGAAGASRSQFVVSSSPSHSGAAGVGAIISIPSLAPGASSSVVSATWWPPATGVYYVSLRADCDNQITESSETNNDYQPWRTITAGNPIATSDRYKIGVVLISAPALSPDPMPAYQAYLDQLVRDVASSKPHRQRGATTVDLVVQMEVRWNQTQSTVGATDFEWHNRFANECRKRGIRWTPLLSTHYVPAFIKTLYAKDQLKAVAPISFDPYQFSNLYLKHAPSSTIWRNDAADWAAQFVRYMAAHGQLGPNGVIDEILVGNELMFPSTNTAGGVLTSKDDSSVARWNVLNTGQAFPMTFSDAFRDFRGRELGFMLRDMLTRVKSELSAAGHGEVLASTKFVPYKFYRTVQWVHGRRCRNCRCCR